MATEVLPAVLEGVDLTGSVLEIGPGPGIVSRALFAYGVDHLTSIEIDLVAAQKLRDEFGTSVTVHTGSATEIPVSSNTFDSIVCCTMLHHVPTTAMQDSLLAEACRVLKIGGVFTGSDSKTDLQFRLFHLFDIHNPVDVGGFEHRLLAAGFAQATVTDLEGRFRFRAIA